MPPRPPARRFLLALALLPLAVAPGSADARQSEPAGPASTATPEAAAPRARSTTLDNIRVGFGDQAPGEFKLGTWTPVWVEVSGGPAGFKGLIEVAAPDDDGVMTSARYPAFVAADQQRRIAVYARPGTTSPWVSVQLLSEDGKPLSPGQQSATFGRVAPEPLDPGTHVVLAMGQVSGLAQVPELAKFKRGYSITPDLIVTPARRLCGEVYGLDSVDAIVLETSEAEVLKELRAGGARVLKEWVAQGGHLIVAIGPNWQEASELLGDLLPATLAEPVRLLDPNALEIFAGSTEPFQGDLTITRLDGWAERGAVPIASTTVSPLVVRGPYGLGRVTLTGIDVAHEPFASWDDRRLFWDKVIDIRGRVEADPTLGVGMGRGAIYQAAAPELAARLHRSLESFPGLKIVPFGWVAFFVFAYIVLIGPVDYLFLRKVVKRMELTWITFPLIVIVTSVLAFVGAYAVKGSDLRVNKVDTLDFDQTTGEVRGNTWLTVFSPSNHDYGLTLTPHGPDFDAKARTLDVADQTLSWFGSPDPILAGIGRISVGQAPYRYAPAGEPKGLEGVRIAIWSTKAFTGHWRGTFGSPIFESDLSLTGGDRVTGSIRNRLDKPLRGAKLYYGRNVYDLGDVRPGGIARVDPTRSEAISRHVGLLARKLEANNEAIVVRQYMDDSRPAVVESRVDILRTAMFHDSLGDRGDAVPNRALRPLDLTAQVTELRRPMLVAEVEAPAATVELTNPPGTPEISQTTLLRVVLPLGDGQAEGDAR